MVVIAFPSVPCLLNLRTFLAVSTAGKKHSICSNKIIPDQDQVGPWLLAVGWDMNPLLALR